MQKFNKTKISLAVGASLLAMVGTAQAAAPAAPTLRGGNTGSALAPLVISAATNPIAARGLYDGTGYNGTLTVTLNFVDSANSATSPSPLTPATLSPGGDGFRVNEAGAVVSTARLAGDDVNIYTVGTVNTDLLVTGFNFIPVTPVTTGNLQVQATIDVASGGVNTAFRMSAAGNLEWIADIATKAVATNWLPVNLAFNANTLGATNAIQAYDSANGANGNANSTPLGVIAGQAIKNGVAPLPKIGTKATTITTSVPGGATAGDLLVDGVTIDTLAPTVAFSAANVAVTTAAVPACPAVDAGSRAIVSTTLSTSTTVATVQITTPSTTADWTSGNTAADNAAYKPACFNTGINDGTVPFIVGIPGTAPAYTDVYIVNTGAKALVDISISALNILDNVAPAIVPGGITFTTPTGTPSLTSVGVTFSEPMTLIGMNDLREVLENILVGTDTLAALSLNSGAAPYLDGITTTAGHSTLTVGGLTATDVATLTAGVWTGKMMSVNRGITYQEVNDTNYTANLATGDTFDTVSGIGAYGEELGGGVISTSGTGPFFGLSGLAEAIPATSAQLAVAPTITVEWGTDTSALASASSATASDQIDTITVTFKAGKSVKFAPAGTVFGTAPALATAKTNADLTANLVIDVHGTNGATVAAMGDATTAIDSYTLTVTSTVGVTPGAVITGVANIPAGTTVVSITNSTQLQMSAPATANAGPVAGAVATGGFTFQVKPLSATLDTANQITVKVPTALIYQKLAAMGGHLAAVYIGYVADGNNAVNNTLVSTDAASTLTSPIRVEHGVLQPFGAGTLAEYANAGAEPVKLPLVFTAEATGGQSTLLTQSIQTNVAGSTGGSIVTAYLASWIDKPMTSISVSGITSGKITNPGDKVAKDLAIEFYGGTGVTGPLAMRIQEELDAVAKATAAIRGVSIAEKAVAAKPIPVYVKLIRSNDVVNSSKGNAAAGGYNYGSSSNGQNYLEARAILATTYDDAKYADTPNQINGVRGADPVFEVMLNPVTGKITGRLTGSITIKTVTTVGDRGLQIWMDGNPIGSSLLAASAATGLPATPGVTFLNLLIGVDPLGFADINGHEHSGTDFGAFAALKPFVLLVYREGGNTPTSGTYTLLTSADPKAANYMPFAPDLFNTTTGPGGVAVRAKAPLSVTDVKALDLPASYNWALFGLGDPALATKPAVVLTEEASFPRRFVGLNTSSGYPMSFWTGDGYTGDIAMSIAGNKVGVATELTDLFGYNGPTLSTISDANRVKGAVGLAWANDNGASDGSTANLGKIYVAQATGTFVGAGIISPVAVPKLAKGWSLVTVPAGGTFGSVVDAVIKVGAQVGITPSATPLTEAAADYGVGIGQFTWFTSDGTPMPTLTAGEAVFVHAKAAGNL